MSVLWRWQRDAQPNANGASAGRYVIGAEQDANERQIEPLTWKQRGDELQLIRRGLSELARCDRDRLTVADQRSFDIIRWDLESRCTRRPQT